jgi:hypothetical protein
VASSNKKTFSRVQGSWAGKSMPSLAPSVSTIKKVQNQATELTYKEDKSVSF